MFHQVLTSEADQTNCTLSKLHLAVANELENELELTKTVNGNNWATAGQIFCYQNGHQW